MLVRHDCLYLDAGRVDCNADLGIFNNCHTDLLWQITVQQTIVLVLLLSQPSWFIVHLLPAIIQHYVKAIYEWLLEEELYNSTATARLCSLLRCEIESTLERLRKLERELYSKEKELEERERRLKLWEERLIERSSMSPSPTSLLMERTSISPVSTSAASVLKGEPLERPVLFLRSSQFFPSMSIGSSSSFFRSHSQDSNSAGVSSAGVSCLFRTLSNGDTERGSSSGSNELMERGVGSLDGGRLHAMLRGLHGRFGDGDEDGEGTLEETGWRSREKDESGNVGGRVQVTLRSFPGGMVEREERTWEEGDREKPGRQRSRVTTIVRGYSGGFGEAEGEKEEEEEEEAWEIDKLGDRLDEGPTMFKGLHGGFSDMLSMDMDKLGDMDRLGEMEMGDLGVVKMVGRNVRSGVGVRSCMSDMGVMMQEVRGDLSEAISQKISEVGVVGHSGMQVSMRASSNQNSVKSCSVRQGTKINVASAAMDMMELDWSDGD